MSRIRGKVAKTTLKIIIIQTYVLKDKIAKLLPPTFI